MLNPFPNLFFLQEFMPTVLRVTVAVALLYFAWRLLSEREALEAVRFPLVGHARGWMLWPGLLLTALIALALLVGYGTQVAALVAMLVMLKGAWFAPKLSKFVPYSRSTYILLAIISFTLLFTGAGLLAFDLPML